MQEMNDIVKEFVKYIGLEKFNPELVQLTHKPGILLSLFVEFEGSTLDSVRKTLEPIIVDLLSSDALKTVIEPLQKENKELKEKVLEFHKYKVFYDMQYDMAHGKKETKEKV